MDRQLGTPRQYRVHSAADVLKLSRDVRADRITSSTRCTRPSKERETGQPADEEVTSADAEAW
jgi:hypothetical protein